MNDPFLGTWKLNREQSASDANHRPSEGTMQLESDTERRVPVIGVGPERQG